MNENRIRRLAGAFLGGFLGIVAFGSLKYWLALPLGCLVGVVAGYWHREVAAGFRRLFIDAVEIWVTEDEFRWSVRTAVAAIKDPQRWHRLLRVLAVVTFEILIVGASLLVLVAIYAMRDRIASPYVFTVLIVGIGILLYVLAIMAPIAAWGVKMELGKSEPYEDTLRRHHEYIRGVRRQRMADLGRWRYFAYDLATLFRCYGAAALATLSGAIVGPLVALGVVALPMALALLVLRVPSGLLRLVQRRDHWPPAAITVAVTALTAWLLSPLTGGMRLWLIALANGCVCGLAVEVVYVAAPRQIVGKASSSLYDGYERVGDACFRLAGRLFRTFIVHLPALSRI